MADTLTSKERSERMALVRSKHTRPEMAVRKLVHGLGYRYRLHGRAIPGKPDLVFTTKKKVIFVHGCFWHRHSDHACKLARMPKSRLDFWGPKLEQNRRRDERIGRELVEQGWQALIVWECQLADIPSVIARIQLLLNE